MQQWNMTFFGKGGEEEEERNLIDSKKLFPQQKGIIRIMTCSSSRTSCKLLFINLVFTIHTIPDEVLVTEFGNLHI